MDDSASLEKIELNGTDSNAANAETSSTSEINDIDSAKKTVCLSFFHLL